MRSMWLMVWLVALVGCVPVGGGGVGRGYRYSRDDIIRWMMENPEETKQLRLHLCKEEP